MRPTKLLFPIEKAIYLLTRETEPGQGGDKQKFWREVLGFDSPESVRAAILDSVEVASLQFQRQDQYGDRYQAVEWIQGLSVIGWWVRTGWIVRFGETVARFVTAIPERSQR
ncbi:MAG: DUF6883 domain-containing protein [Cyanobacteria bacterium P01_A01_bin.116]